MRFLLICLFSIASIARANEPGLLSFGVGIFEALRNNSHKTAEFRVEYQPGVNWYTVRPLVGFMATARGGTYLYGGFSLDWVIKKRLLFSPNFAAGWYRAGGGKNLGFPLEFRSGVEVGWCLLNKCRMGIHFYHISNASLGYKNPGEESLDFFFAFPFP